MEYRAAIRVDPYDNVLVALKDIQCSEEVETGLIARELIPAKQKLSATHFKIGQDIKMYGVVVGSAIEEILPGQFLGENKYQMGINQDHPQHHQLEAVFKRKIHYNTSLFKIKKIIK